jgi:molybdopterin-guanine dinucleotide biosynthesis protein A
MSDPVAVILAGGASSRMGTDKASYVVRGRTMLEWVVDAARATLGEVVIVGRTQAAPHTRAIPDSGGSRRGPLSGIVTALEALRSPIVAIAVDQPLIRVQTLQRLAAEGDPTLAAVPIDNGWEQVTCARYPLEVLDAARQELDAGGNIRNLFRSLDAVRIEPATWRRWGEDGRSWFSIDEPGDVVTAERRFRLDLH